MTQRYREYLAVALTSACLWCTPVWAEEADPVTPMESVRSLWSVESTETKVEADRPKSECGATEEARPCAEPVVVQQGRASWYGPGLHGRRTANGERFDMYALTAAHRTLPFGTLLRVRSLVNGSEVDVRVNDRGPFTPGVVIDLSKSAAEAIGLLGLGIKEVSLTVVSPDGAANALVAPYVAARVSDASVKPMQQRRTVTPVKRRPPPKPVKRK